MINYNNKMKELLGNNLEMMIKNRAFDRCSWIEEDEDQIYGTIEHTFDLYKDNDFEDMLDVSDEVSEEYCRQSEIYTTQLLFTK